MILDEFFKPKPAAVLAEGLGDLRPTLGSKRDQGKSVRKWRKARGLGEQDMDNDNLQGGGPDDEVKFFIDSEPAYYAVMDRFGDHIDFRGDDMVAPLRLWGAIQQTAGDAGGAADIAGLEDEPMWVGDELDEQGVAEGSLNEFAVEPSDGEDDDEYDLLVKLVKMWWVGDEHQHIKAEKTLALMGISIDEDDPDIILRRGTQFLTFPMDDFQQGMAEGNGRLNEFAPSAGGGSGDYFQALASAWYNGAFDTGSLEKGIKSKEDVERLLNRGIIGPDGVTRKYAIDYNSTFEGVVISSDDYYEHSDYNDQGQEVDSRNGRPWGPYDYMEFDDEELDESAKWRDPKYKGQLYTQEPPDYNDTREYDNARFNPKPKGYAGRKELPGGGEYDRTDPLVRGAGIGRSGIKNNILDRGKRKGLPSRDQITSLKQSIRDISGQHTRANLPEQGMAEGHGNYAGDRPVNLGGVSMKKIQIGDTVRYIDQTAQVVDMSRDREHARITIPSSATTKTVLTSDLRPLGRGVSEETLSELSPATLARYKTKAGAAATAADSAGDRKTGDRRFSGIVKATKKQFDQDAKQSAQAVHESRLRLMASIIKTQ